MNGKIHEMLVLAMDHNTVMIRKPFDTSKENTRESFKSIIKEV